MSRPQKLRRPGYAPVDGALGRRGLDTRKRIVARAGQLFVANGFHGTSIDAIADAVAVSRATVYQYFESKDEIFLELYRDCEPEVVAHARRLGGLGPSVEGIRHLHQWLDELAFLYEKFAVVFLEFPGIGAVQGVGAVPDRYAEMMAGKLRDAGVSGIDAADAAAVLTRIAHIVNLYRVREMFGLHSRAATSASLAIAMQLLLFPETPTDALRAVAAASATESSDTPAADFAELPLPAELDSLDLSPVRQDILSAASMLFAERGYDAVAMEDIAAAADVSRATLYRHFNTKVKILAELNDSAEIEGNRVSAELHQLAGSPFDVGALHVWLGRFVHFHRTHSGVVRSWFDGTLARQLPDSLMTQGLGVIHGAVVALLRSVELPTGMDPAVAAAVLLAVLGRLTELPVAQRRKTTDYESAGLMMTVLQRTLLGVTT